MDPVAMVGVWMGAVLATVGVGRLLAASDWTQVADAPVDSAAWAVYRQTLRDIPQDYTNPDDVVWPIPPA